MHQQYTECFHCGHKNHYPEMNDINKDYALNELGFHCSNCNTEFQKKTKQWGNELGAVEWAIVTFPLWAGAIAMVILSGFARF
jgi:hypothetical protein